ncbi:alanine racemase [Paractinoplanes atraurantiacus]|uniref:D-serine deaminase, pyridoxal phosphate-dependent n=1 Tax=Paractinoplanes atraurantiacus TaxID=1036182 RepID=A0A285J773_9ACTN|nr:alanine racemase [Actinoplanes atraurantiacus]SNY56062.1 D-serine deaminase, pyridoxal phosphate-dependent [Actinoplanes atraurantiacus]
MRVPEVTVDWRSKGFWLPDGARSAAGIARERPGLFDGLLTWPVLVLRRAAAEANIATMAAYCRRHGWDFAPHAKTTMAPGLLKAQLDAGAWGMTVATANQALVLRRLGVQRILIANEVLDPVALRWLAGEPDIYFQVDSLEGVRAAKGKVLVELGHAHGRTGVRSLDELEAVARAAVAADGLELVGVTAYEGQLKAQQEVDDFLDLLVAGVDRLAKEGLLPAEPIVSAGGSAWFDRVIDRLAGVKNTRLVLRSGASVTHDDGFYRERTPFLRVPAEGPLAAALEIWAQVTSTPEPGLALVGMGKRDAPFDEGLPVPMEIRRVDGSYAATTGIEVTKLNDHHTYMAAENLVPGDLIRFGISHPCTAFDKWRHIPVIDEDRRVVDVLETYF